MLQSQRWSLLALGLLLFALPIASQTETGESPAALESDGEARESDTPATRPDTQAARENPFDYRASEEISEDVPVSFPVDI